MTQTPEEFFKLASRVVDIKYAGEPKELTAFIEQVELLEPMVEQQSKQIHIKFICSHLTGIAREVVPEKPESIKEIVDALRTNIKTEPSKVIEGKILALRAKKTSLSKFSERAEKLAEDFRRSLVIEGFTKAKAQEITIEKTIEMCRKSAKSEAVKAVLSASKFTTPNEVIAKLITEQNMIIQERQTQGDNRTQNQNFKNNRFRGKRGRKGWNSSRPFNRNGNDRNGHANSSSTFRNSNGRSNYRYNRSNRTNSNRGNHNNGNRNEQVLRIVAGSENFPGPSEERRPQNSASERAIAFQ